MRPFVLLALLAVPAVLSSQGAADEPGIMLSGDAKNVIGELVKQLSGGSGTH